MEAVTTNETNAVIRLQSNGRQITSSFSGQSTMATGGSRARIIVDRILCLDCPPIFSNRPYEATPCEYAKYNEVISRLKRMDRSNLDDIVTTMVPGQGFKPITLLEASILTRNVPIISWLLANGANPNVTSTGVPLTQQLHSPVEDITMALIIQMLVSAGAPPALVSPFTFDRHGW